MTSQRSFGTVEPLPSGRFRARYTVPGEYRRRTAPLTFDTRKAANNWLTQTHADVLRGDYRDPDAGAITVAEYADRYLSARAGVDLAPRTVALYRRHLARYIAAPVTAPGLGTVRLGGEHLASVDVATVRDWYAAVTHTAATTAGARCKRAPRVHPARMWARDMGRAVPSTGRLPAAVVTEWEAAGAPVPHREAIGDTGKTQAAQAYRVLRAILAAALDEGLIRENPCRIRKAGTTRAAERVPATPAQIDAIAAAMPDRLAAAVHVAAWSGLRAGELFALDRSRVSLDRNARTGTVRVDRALIGGSGPATYGPPKTTSSVRTIHLPPHVVEILAAHLDAYPGRGASALVFTTPAGGPVYESHRHRHFSRAREAAGRSDLRWHDLRHTGATLAARTGASIREIQHRLGHSTASAAMIYQHHTADRDADLAARLSDLAAPAATEPAPPPQADGADESAGGMASALTLAAQLIRSGAGADALESLADSFRQGTGGDAGSHVEAVTA
ncbi:site-specific integrase [Gordonia sp. HY002]|uniref:tyrosine-type recombinase/integrase n=1 Tax=Gordonia zhenghanii TaxID=2911516 RepID=UPI001EEFB2DE|nr:site-specific integrase [Gordonia zhenghanii]MCF8572336.1 site-specific integrase [Gordonia zhenghanii]MCF8607304.1 site-specific integrase [Gordonia zhenghanii]